MTSVRLDDRLQARLRATAKLTGQTVSCVVREAIESHCDQALGVGLDQRLADVIGSVAGDGSGYSERTGEAFAELLTRSKASQ
jgi:hypothetical protein